jgi:hypothetical protein
MPVTKGTVEVLQDCRFCEGIEREGQLGSRSSRWDGAFVFHYPGNSCQATIIQSLRDQSVRALQRGAQRRMDQINRI